MDLATVLITVIKPAKEDEQCKPLLACPGGGEEKLSRFPQTPHHKPRRDCLLLQRCKVLGLLQTRNFTLFILISIDKMR
jgi:hypothetical protein